MAVPGPGVFCSNPAVSHATRTFRTPDGLDLHVEVWTPEDRVRFVVVIAHGGSEHVGRYDALARRWNERGALVFGPDHRGQGLSGGQRGHVDGFGQYVSDLRLVLSRMIQKLPEAQRPDAVPWFLFGHSMGGLISLSYLLEHPSDADDAIPLRGAIISSPLIALAIQANPVTVVAARVLDKLAPNVPVTPPDLAPFITRDPEVVRIYDNDARRARKLTPRWNSSMEAATVHVRKRVHELKLPMLWYVGTGDKICDCDATIETFERLPRPDEDDQRIHVFDGYYHELHNEPRELAEPVLELVDTWLAQRVPG